MTHRGMYNSPAYTMRCLCPPKPPFVTPGPPTYRYEDYPPYMEPRAPIWTMAARTRYPLVNYKLIINDGHHLTELFSKVKARFN